MSKIFSKIKNCVGGILIGIFSLLWLDASISSGTVYWFIMRKIGMPEPIIAGGALMFVAVWLIAEVYLAIREHKTSTNEI